MMTIWSSSSTGTYEGISDGSCEGVNMKTMECPACGAKLKKSDDLCYDIYGEIMNGNVYRCVQCATTVIVPF
jgi:predicted nucleic acid-binding Zn ribbon protein